MPDHTITGQADGKVTHTRARPGARLPVEIATAEDAAPVTRTLTLRKPRRGDASGAPLGC